MELVFVDRFADPVFDLDLATVRCVFVPHYGVIGKAGEDGIHIVCIARVKLGLNDWRKRQRHRV